MADGDEEEEKIAQREALLLNRSQNQNQKTGSTESRSESFIERLIAALFSRGSARSDSPAYSQQSGDMGRFAQEPSTNTRQPGRGLPNLERFTRVAPQPAPELLTKSPVGRSQAPEGLTRFTDNSRPNLMEKPLRLGGNPDWDKLRQRIEAEEMEGRKDKSGDSNAEYEKQQQEAWAKYSAAQKAYDEARQNILPSHPQSPTAAPRPKALENASEDFDDVIAVKKAAAQAYESAKKANENYQKSNKEFFASLPEDESRWTQEQKDRVKTAKSVAAAEENAKKALDAANESYKDQEEKYQQQLNKYQEDVAKEKSDKANEEQKKIDALPSDDRRKQDLAEKEKALEKAKQAYHSVAAFNAPKPAGDPRFAYNDKAYKDAQNATNAELGDYAQQTLKGKVEPNAINPDATDPDKVKGTDQYKKLSEAVNDARVARAKLEFYQAAMKEDKAFEEWSKENEAQKALQDALAHERNAVKATEEGLRTTREKLIGNEGVDQGKAKNLEKSLEKSAESLNGAVDAMETERKRRKEGLQKLEAELKENTEAKERKNKERSEALKRIEALEKKYGMKNPYQSVSSKEEERKAELDKLKNALQDADQKVKDAKDAFDKKLEAMARAPQKSQAVSQEQKPAGAPRLNGNAEKELEKVRNNPVRLPVSPAQIDCRFGNHVDGGGYQTTPSEGVPAAQVSPHH